MCLIVANHVRHYHLSRMVTTIVVTCGEFTFISVRQRVCQYLGKANK
jgi:hypothetical protein